jgi:hypothetical protein
VHLASAHQGAQIASRKARPHPGAHTLMIPQGCGLHPHAQVEPIPPISVPRVWIWQRKNTHRNQLGIDAEDEGCVKTNDMWCGGVDDVR